MVKYVRKTNVFNVGYHLIFCPKYRKPYLFKFVPLIKKNFYHIAKKLEFKIEEIDIMPDHIHIFIKCQSLKHTIPSIVHMLKGSTSFKIRKRYPFLKKYRAFWSPSYFCETIGNMSENVIRKYIQNQKVNLKSTYKYLNMVTKLNISSVNSSRTKYEIITSQLNIIPTCTGKNVSALSKTTSYNINQRY